MQRHTRSGPTACAVLLLCMGPGAAMAQDNATPNGIADNRADAYAFTGGLIHRPDGALDADATLLIREGSIVGVNPGEDVPPGYFQIDLNGRHVYPGLIDIYSEYGQKVAERVDDNGAAENLHPGDRALNVNDAIKANFRAGVAYQPDPGQRKELRERGFTTVLSVRRDGIARGTSALITLGDKNAGEAVIVPDAAAHYSLDKGSSAQAMPSSLMGAYALLRQTYLDARWFGELNPRPFADATLEAWLRNRSLPQIMEVSNWHQAVKADEIGDEFGVQYILKTGGDSYRRLDLLRRTGAALIVPVNFPEAPEVEDVLEADEVSFADLKHWELAPFNPRLLAEAGIPFALTAHGSGEDFWDRLRRAVANGLPEEVAIAALTQRPAEMLGVSGLVGEISGGRLANFIITDGPLLDEGSTILESWIQGERYRLADENSGLAGRYLLAVGGSELELTLRFEEHRLKAELQLGGDETRPVHIERSDELIAMNFSPEEGGDRLRLNGWPEGDGWRGNGRDGSGATVTWTMTRLGAIEPDEAPSSEAAEAPVLPSPVLYPFSAYGREALPAQRDLLVRGATVWTNEDMGTVVTDVLVRNGRIAEVGDNLSANDVTVVDGSGKHLTPGIIDEHSHIALFSINETQTNSSMVRMKDVVNSENINIYRNLAGGVVASQLLHGSANPIGGQSALVKMRWGLPPSGLLIEDADEFIKFALGENVKRSTNPASIRYPQTRMGVEQVFVNAFSQAREYGSRWDEYNSLSRSRQGDTPAPRRDLVNEAMLEILNGERFVTSHSYVQSEINMLMHVADSFNFNINTFTHILEGYKVADKMARHGAGGSTFSDWWGYKWEVRYAIPYNAALMQQAGVVVAINSDDAEMSRRLNQEAAKTVKYGDVSEVDALKMVTLNPAILLHLDDRMGSIRAGKDADLVLWSDHPLSVYAVPETTWIEGVPYYDREEDLQLRQQIAAERARIIAKIIEADDDEEDGGEAAGEARR